MAKRPRHDRAWSKRKATLVLAGVALLVLLFFALVGYDAHQDGNGPAFAIFFLMFPTPLFIIVFVKSYIDLTKPDGRYGCRAGEGQNEDTNH